MNKPTLYYRLTKPGIVWSNSFVAVGAYLFASKWEINVGVFLGLVIGVILIIASACVTNNVLDRRIDKMMSRTKNRALVSGEISVKSALLYSFLLGILGLSALISETNTVTTVLGIFAFVFYVVIYGYAKRKTVYGTAVGTIPGALPPVAGYTAATGRLDLTALLLFIILVFWQMAHFYAIALFRKKDYAAARLPVASVVRDQKIVKLEIIYSIIIYTAACISLTILTDANPIFSVAMGIIGAYWLIISLRYFNSLKIEKWALKVFLISLINIVALPIMLSVSSLLP